jgi:hypothetical protein
MALRFAGPLHRKSFSKMGSVKKVEAITEVGFLCNFDVAAKAPTRTHATHANSQPT